MTVSFQSDIVQADDNLTKSLLIGAWIAYLISILFGIVAMMGLTGILALRGGDASIRSMEARVGPMLQAVTIVTANKRRIPLIRIEGEIGAD